MKKANRCFLCLRPGHRASECKSKPCDIDGCGKRHNRMLHQTRKPSTKTDDKQTSSVANAASSMVVSSINGILPVVKIKLTNGQNSVETYALCDSGSSVSFMDKQIQKQLNVLGFKTQLSVVGFNGSKKCIHHTVN